MGTKDSYRCFFLVFSVCVGLVLSVWILSVWSLDGVWLDARLLPVCLDTARLDSIWPNPKNSPRSRALPKLCFFMILEGFCSFLWGPLFVLSVSLFFLNFPLRFLRFS